MDLEDIEIVEPIPPPHAETYQNNVLCIYNFQSLEQNTFITFRIEYIDLEENYDFLLFGNGGNPSSSSSIFAKLTGEPIIRAMTSTSTKSWMTFTTDIDGVAKGYQIIVALIHRDNLTGKTVYRLFFLYVNSELAICPVARHGNANSIQNLPTVTNLTMELYCILLPLTLPCCTA